MGITKIYNRLIEYLMNFRKLLLETSGILLLRQWKQTEKENIVTIEEPMLPEVLRIQAEGFKKSSQDKLIRYSKKFKKVFYIIKNEDKIAGYCMYYPKPTVSFRGFEKQAVISSIAIDKDYRGKGLAEKLLIASIGEMKLNKVSSILLYVNVNNLPALKLYEKMGFQKTKEIKDICGQNERCYEMILKIS
jgi:ribosomal-protein-alanine N-acetyltransferase